MSFPEHYARQQEPPPKLVKMLFDRKERWLEVCMDWENSPVELYGVTWRRWLLALRDYEVHLARWEARE